MGINSVDILRKNMDICQTSAKVLKGGGLRRFRVEKKYNNSRAGDVKAITKYI